MPRCPALPDRRTAAFRERLEVVAELFRARRWLSILVVLETTGWTRRVAGIVLREFRRDAGLVEHRFGQHHVYTLRGEFPPLEVRPDSAPAPRTRTERICVGLGMLAFDPGWMTVEAYIERTGAPDWAAHVEVRLLRRRLELIEHSSGRMRAWTLPGRPAPPLPPSPPRKRLRYPRPPRGKGILARQLAMGVAAYELGAAGVPWDQVAERVGYGSNKAAWRAARNAADRRGWRWPLKYRGRR